MSIIVGEKRLLKRIPEFLTSGLALFESQNSFLLQHLSYKIDHNNFRSLYKLIVEEFAFFL